MYTQTVSEHNLQACTSYRADSISDLSMQNSLSTEDDADCLCPECDKARSSSISPGDLICVMDATNGSCFIADQTLEEQDLAESDILLTLGFDSKAFCESWMFVFDLTTNSLGIVNTCRMRKI